MSGVFASGSIISAYSKTNEWNSPQIIISSDAAIYFLDLRFETVSLIAASARPSAKPTMATAEATRITFPASVITRLTCS